MSDILETQLLIALAFYVLCFLLTLYVPLVSVLVLCRYSNFLPQSKHAGLTCGFKLDVCVDGFVSVCLPCYGLATCQGLTLSRSGDIWCRLQHLPKP